MSNLTDEQIRGVFDLFDADGSGFVDAEELSLALQALGFGALSKTDIDAVVAEVSSDGNTHIEFAEFKKLCRNRMATRNSAEEVTRAFHQFDHGAKGFINFEDFCAVAAELGEIGTIGADAEKEKKLREAFQELLREANAAFPSEVAKPENTLSLVQWKQVMRQAVSDKHRRHDEGAFSIQTRARVAKKGPFGVKVEAGRTYYYCTCGHSKNQPFCDGSHATVNRDHGTDFQPIKYVADQTRTVWFCGCKQSKAAPFCDGSHATL